MNPDDLRKLMAYLEARIRLGAQDSRTIVFDVPTLAEMESAGFDKRTCQRLLDASWWSEMVDDVVETPEYSDPGETTDQLLRYARDVVVEYIRKRFLP
jgi:hypothetical protein